MSRERAAQECVDKANRAIVCAIAFARGLGSGTRSECAAATERRASSLPRRLAPAPTEESATARELMPGWKLARHRASVLQGLTGSTRARQKGLSGGVHDRLDEQHAAR